MNQLPTQIGPYVVLRELGEGGMGTVYYAETLFAEPAAVKVIRRGRIDPVARQRFEREAHIACAVIGTNQVAKFFEADSHAEEPWLAMEYVPGTTLSACVEDQGPLPPAFVAMLGGLLANGLAKVHEAGLLHRDITPRNIMMSERGPVLIDFGLGALVKREVDDISKGGTVGTTRCMAPEQTADTVDITYKTDIYGLGVVLLYAATGHLPYAGTEFVVMNRIANRDEPPDLSGLPPVLEPLLSGLLAHDQEDRPELDEVVAMTTKILNATGVTPGELRKRLIRRTYQVKPDPVQQTPSAEQRVAQLLEEFGREIAEPGPLDRAVGGDGLAAPAEEESEHEPGLVPAMSGGSSSSPAARRVADDLRVRYSAQTLLWSSGHGGRS